MRALGIDLGSKRIGIALADTHGTVATPVDTVLRSGDRRSEHARIAELVSEWEATIAVVGLPKSLDGSIGLAAQACLAEIRSLAAVLEVPVVAFDERLTTVTAQQHLIRQGLRGEQRRKVIDRVAAAVMLQSWLDAGCPQPGTETVDG